MGEAIGHGVRSADANEAAQRDGKREARKVLTEDLLYFVRCSPCCCFTPEREMRLMRGVIVHLERGQNENTIALALCERLLESQHLMHIAIFLLPRLPAKGIVTGGDISIVCDAAYGGEVETDEGMVDGDATVWEDALGELAVRLGGVLVEGGVHAWCSGGGGGEEGERVKGC